MGTTVRDLLQARPGVALTPRFFAGAAQVFAAASSVVMPQDPSRIGFILVNHGGFDIFVTPAGPATVNNGIRVPSGGGSVTAIWDEDGEVVAWEWQAIANGGNSAVFKIETLIVGPKGHPQP